METAQAHNDRLTGRIELPAPMPVEQKVKNPDKTHSGNLNRSTPPSPVKDEGAASVGKPNDPECSLRKGNLPAASAVTVLPVEGDKTIAPRCARKQNVSLTSDGTEILNVIPNSGKAVLTHPKGGE